MARLECSARGVSACLGSRPGASGFAFFFLFRPSEHWSYSWESGDDDSRNFAVAGAVLGFGVCERLWI